MDPSFQITADSAEAVFDELDEGAVIKIAQR